MNNVHPALNLGNLDNVPAPRRFSFGKQIKMSLLRISLCGSDKLPASFAGRFEGIAVHNTSGHLIGYFTVVVERTKPSARKSSQHRVFIECACGRLIPAGRLQQHGYGCDKAYEAPSIGSANPGRYPPAKLARLHAIEVKGEAATAKEIKEAQKLRCELFPG